MLQNPISRRGFLRASGQSALIGGLAATGILGLESLFDRAPEACAATVEDSRPLVWVWKFSADGPPDPIRYDLATNGLGIILKTNDGTQWMTKFDSTEHAVTGPAQIEKLARYFEDAGIPFHTWFVAKGVEPLWEARMCSDVLNAGSRSIYIDLEPPEGDLYWQGSPRDAMVFGEELRRLQPNAIVTVAPDARPWQVPAVPVHEYISFSNRVAPQSYWQTFNSPTNLRYLRERGFGVGPEGFTPELVVEVAKSTFAFSGLPVQPIGQGAAPADHWHRFITAASGNGMTPISLWRYATADPAAFGVMRDLHAQAMAQAAPPPQPAAPVETLVEAPAGPPAQEPAVALDSTETASGSQATTETAGASPVDSPATPVQQARAELDRCE